MSGVTPTRASSSGVSSSVIAIRGAHPSPISRSGHQIIAVIIFRLSWVRTTP